MLGYDHFQYKNGVLCCDGVSVDDIAQHVGTPVYIYSAKHIKEQYLAFTEAFKNLGREDILTAFAVKSCSNINVLKILADLGAGADIVSEGEMRRALKANIPAEKIMFSGVGKSKQEIIYALKHKIGVINVESEPELELIAKTAQELNVTAPISLRVNPDVVAKTLPGISTGKKGDKFGIALDLVRDVYKKASKMAAIDLKGLDFHIGSQVFDVEEFRPAFEKVRKLLCDIRSEDGLAVTHIDCGGGLGVPYHPHETPPNMQDYAKLVLDYFGDLEVKLAFEPGRFISGNAGILVSKLLYEKQDSDEWCCLIIDAAMNDLARPAIYGAYHHIVPVQDNTTKPIKKYDIVGPVCESTDTFAKNYTFPQLGQGDLVAFLTAGAYGATMSSHYNTRLDAPEVLVEKGAFHIIKRRPTYDTLFELEMI